MRSYKPLWLMVLILFAAMAATQVAHGQPGVVQPGDIATPTIIPHMLPTVTPSPSPTVSTPGVQTNSRFAMQSISLAGAAGYESVTGGSQYTVREGDTLWTVSLEVGVDLDVMPCLVSPHYRADQPLVIGNMIEVPIGGLVCHEVQAGETLRRIATDNRVAVELLTTDPWNELGGVEVDVPLEKGRYIRFTRPVNSEDTSGYLAFLLDSPITDVPLATYGIGGPAQAKSRHLPPDDWPYGSGYFDWPTYGWISQSYRNDHRALDIAANAGSLVTAADRGVVIRAGWNNQGYGNFVIIDHNIDYVTLYGHLDEIFVAEGDIVAKGQLLGTVGSTGNSTGPHLHFEVRDFGSRINPLEVLVR